MSGCDSGNESPSRFLICFSAFGRFTQQLPAGGAGHRRGINESGCTTVRAVAIDFSSGPLVVDYFGRSVELKCLRRKEIQFYCNLRRLNA